MKSSAGTEIRENWYALLIAILTGKTVESSFAVFEGWNWDLRHSWNEAEVKRVNEMRKKGMTWNQIGDVYGMSGAAVNRAIRYARKRFGIKEGKK